MDAGLHGVEFEAPGRIAPTVGKMRGKPSEKPENHENPALLLRMVKRAGLAGVKSDRLLEIALIRLDRQDLDATGLLVNADALDLADRQVLLLNDQQQLLALFAQGA